MKNYFQQLSVQIFTMHDRAGYPFQRAKMCDLFSGMRLTNRYKENRHYYNLRYHYQWSLNVSDMISDVIFNISNLHQVMSL